MGNPLKALAGQHFIGGAWRGGSDGFDLRQRIEPFATVGTWPRANESLTVEALQAARVGRSGWQGLSAVERADGLRRVLKHLRSDVNWSEHLSQLLGLESTEIEEEYAALDALIENDVLFDSGSNGTQPTTGDVATEVGVVFARWTDLVSGLFGRIVTQLKRDRGVVLISDDRWPAGADSIGAAFSSAGMPSGLISILHGLPGPLKAALEGMTNTDHSGASFAANSVLQSTGAFAELRNSEVRFALDLGGFERGNSSFIVRKETELDSAVEQIIEQAFGRAKTFSGQRTNRVARVICNVRRFSAFCESLVSALESSPDVNQPLPLIDNEALSTTRSLWNLGLDEGATLIFGGEPFKSPTGSRARDPRVWPAVFTNVDSEMAVSRFRETAPVLCLIRADDDEAAELLARELD
ncbi:MAG: succinate-semialdehyde dehydrogenase/glutarate-semialdehyde dehydrogenase [Planctomycetota bacterium]|jgi:succinate-semialdehyde dehydrogenase/glutarate-semialdehyde dehydrogenase